ncbi:phosphonate C-P lyase system protein PhnG [Geminicoccaceae bacterium 1502E]|nr:phosphonate C-P lyase system protein PhnG [Geminicoccaceae bacterium 1502E]
MNGTDLTQTRRRWLGVLAAAPAEALADAWAREGDAPPMRYLRAPETGLVMVRGRMGGTGRRFNMGEMTVTRCAVVAGDTVGHGYVAGRDKRRAEMVARLDALLQMDGRRERLLRDLVEPLAAAQAKARAATARKAAATKVDFFTLVRGEG